MLKPRHQILSSLLPASFIEDLGLGLDDPLLRSLGRKLLRVRACSWCLILVEKAERANLPQ
jgi:hypothetical protein